MNVTPTSLDFFSPVTYMPEPGILTTKSIWALMQETADNFFSYGPTLKRAYVVEKRENVLNVKLIECESPMWKTVLKLSLLITPLSSIMIAIKIFSRSTQTFTITEQGKKLSPKRVEILKFTLTQSIILKEETIVGNYAARCTRAGISFEKATLLQKHVLFFTDNNGNITKKSLQKGLQKLHAWRITAFIAASIIMNGLHKVMKNNDSLIKLTDINKAMHSSDTGVINHDGTFNAEKFNDLKTKYPSLNVDFLSIEDLTKMRKDNFDRDLNSAGQDSTRQKDAKTGAEASDKEFGLTLRLFSDCAYVDNYGNVTPAISITRLQRLYLEGPMLFEQVAAL